MAEKERYIIGLTGNIGSGKSMVLNMLRHLGAYGIDADELTRRAYHLPEVQSSIQQRFGTINRQELAEIVFSDVKALAELEAIIHPMVSQMVETLAGFADHAVIVIEAIKLLESDLAGMCDSIWVVDTDAGAVVDRLKNHRGMDEEEINARLAHQTPVSEKIKQAHVVIDNSNTRKTTWRQITQAWSAIMEDTIFSTIKDDTQKIFSQIDKITVKPFSNAQEDLQYLIGDRQKLLRLPLNQPITHAQLEGMICNGFLLDPTFYNEDAQYFVGKINTFQFAIDSILQFKRSSDIDKMQSILIMSETIARTFHVEQIRIPIAQALQEKYADVLLQFGFHAISEESESYALWHKAGYNVFNKRIWDFDAYLKGKQYLYRS